MTGDPFDLGRFVAAQEPVYPDVLDELRSGRKRSHWMWFVFPQLDGLGSSELARRFAIRDIEEARAYLAHPLLGARLVECTELVNAAATDIEAMFGHPDDLKFHSSVTLFGRAAGRERVFAEALRRFFAGREDERTRALLEQ